MCVGVSNVLEAHVGNIALSAEPLGLAFSAFLMSPFLMCPSLNFTLQCSQWGELDVVLWTHLPV